MKLKFTLCLFTLGLAGLTGFAQLLPLQYNGSYLGGRLVYDPNTDLTWYQAPYTNVTWSDAIAWAPALGIGGATWRLPGIDPATVVDAGYSMDVSGKNDDGELAHMWYDDLGNQLNNTTNSGPFDPVAFTTGNYNWYWTSSGPWYGHLATWAVAFDVEHGLYGVMDIQGNQTLCGEMAVCNGNISVAPSLTAALVGSRVVVSWPALATGWTLQTNTTLAPSGWGDYTGAIVNNTVTNVPSTGALFFRLKQ